MEFNLGTLVATNVGSLIVGMSLTAMTLYINFSNKLGLFEGKQNAFSATQETTNKKLDELSNDLKDHIKAPTSVCPIHQEAERDINSLKTQAAINTDRIQKLEEAAR